MAIAPVSGLSMNPIEKVQMMNYSVSNEGNVSDVYNAESTKNTAGVDAVSPVRYPNATVVADTSKTAKAYDSTEVAKSYNELASDYKGMTTGYDSSSKGTSFSLIGNNIDVYA